MPIVADFEIASIQATIFTPGLSFVPSRILANVLQKRSELFDGTPISIPGPPDMPPEIPRVILQSSEGQSKIEFSPIRTNFFWIRVAETDTINLKDFLLFAATLLCEYATIVSAKIGRMAAVVNRFAKEDNPGPVIAQHFCREKWTKAPFDSPESFEIHAHKRYNLGDGFNINSWVRCKTGFAGKRPTQKPIILVEQDINTISEEMEEKEFTEKDINMFFKLLPDEFDHILSLYFPSEG